MMSAGCGNGQPRSQLAWSACLACFMQWAVLICPLALAQPPDVDSLVMESRFQRTARYLHDASPEMRAEFATSALRELAEVYMAEADLARKQAEDQVNGSKLRAWSIAVDQYAGQIALLLADIELGLPVELRASEKEAVTVVVADRATILSHPRVDQQATYEQRVLLDFCGRSDCKVLTAQAEAAPQPIPVSASQVNPVWKFTERGPVCSHNGIELRFSGARNLARSRATCQQLLQEIMTLINEIAWQQRHGVTVQWQAIAIHATPDRPEHLVQLNGSGDSVLATVPLIHSSPELLRDITPWLQESVQNKKPAALQLDAARYGWERTGDDLH
jgi:hypothetical protein